MKDADRFLDEHLRLSRRYFLAAGAAVPLASSPLFARHDSSALAKAIDKLEPYFTSQDEFRDVSRGRPRPHSLPTEKKREVGLTRETWKLDILSDPKHPASLGKEFKKSNDTALSFQDLMQIAKTHAVRFPKVMTCLNIGCPLGMGIWEGVPLREVIWRTQPKSNLRRVFYFGYHNDDPKQMFRSSLPIGRVLEDPFDLPPVILCYKLNGEWLTSERGGPVRIVVPEAYGFKSIKWLSHLMLTNLATANDTYAERNNDVDSPLKTFAATLQVPQSVKADEPIPITGYAQVGISGLKKVQVWIAKREETWPEDDPYFTKAPWIDADILDAPKTWENQPSDRIPKGTMGFDKTGRPETWPMRLGKVHWAVLLPKLAPGEYTLRSRTIDAKGHAQPMPRPFRKSGHAAIEDVDFTVTE